MRKILLALLVSFGASTAFADTCATKLMPVFTADQAKKLCVSFGSAINSSMIPSATNTYDLGSSSLRWKDLYLSGSVFMNAAASKIIPGATSFSFRNSADSGDNVTIASGSGNVTLAVGDLILSTTGKTLSVQEATAASACMGVATPNGTTPVTVTTSCAVTGSRVIFSRVGAVANMASISVTTNPNNTSFAFASTGATDTLASSVVYLIVKESA